MRWVLNEDERRLIPCTMYPLFSRNSARYAPSWPVIPVIRAVLVMVVTFLNANFIYSAVYSFTNFNLKIAFCCLRCLGQMYTMQHFDILL